MSKNNKILLSYNKNFTKYDDRIFFDEYTQKIYAGFNKKFKKNKFFISINKYKKTNLYSVLLFKN